MALLETPEAKSALFFAGGSLFTQLLAKVVVTRFFFDYPIVILMLQHAATLFLVEVLRLLSIVKLPAYSFDRGRHLFVPSLLLAVSSWLSVASLEGIGMPVFDSVKRWSSVVVVLLSGVMLKKGRPESQKGLLIVTGISLTAALTVNFDLSLDRFSFFYGCIAAITQAVAYVQLETLSASFSPIELTYLHAFNSLVIFLLSDIVQDEVRDAFMYMMTSANGLFTCLLLILLATGFLLNFATMHCLTANGALGTSLVSNVRAAVQIMIAYYCGVHLFYDLVPSFLNWAALFTCAAFATVFYRTQKKQAIHHGEKVYGPLP